MVKQTEARATEGEGREVERAFLVGIEFPDSDPSDTAELLKELAALTDTLGLAVAGQLAVRIRAPKSRYLVGIGKAREICQDARACGADVIIFDDPLTPSQQRNWERLADFSVIDRQEVILDIFAARAHTRAAELQVALAQATYDLPGLKRRWTHLSRQRGMRGGRGLRGEGEQQIQVDYRLVRKRISRLKQELAEVRKHRRTQRSRRLKKPVPVAAIVGYTNAGKSSLLNALTDADVLVEDRLFATLDPTVRRIVLPNRQELLLTDTVGFVRKLPHLLIEAFKGTLEETLMADFLIEIIDAGAMQAEQHHRATREVLTEVGAQDKPVITVLNKIDLTDDRFSLRRLRRRFPDAVFISAKTRAGLDALQERLTAELDRALRRVELFIPHDRYDLIALLHRTSNVLGEEHEAGGVRISASIPLAVLSAVTDFLPNKNALSC